MSQATIGGVIRRLDYSRKEDRWVRLKETSGSGELLEVSGPEQ